MHARFLWLGFVLAACTTSRTYGGMGLLYWTGGKMGDCVIRVLYKMRDSNDNSGVFIRRASPGRSGTSWKSLSHSFSG